MKRNPYTLTFGKEPAESISRPLQLNEIIDTFRADRPSQQIYMISGVRGAGKTVFMSELSSYFQKEEDWVVTELNPNKNMLEELASHLSNEHTIAQIFKNAKINLSFWNFGIEFNTGMQLTDIDTALYNMLEALQKKQKKLLITIDEVISSENMHIFASTYQIMLRKNLPVFLLMTGLYENINQLQNEKSLTFLYRAPKITLKPLNLGSIASNYKSVFNLDQNTSRDMAALTLGYPFAFQVLGYMTWKYNGNYKDALSEYRQYLEEYVYEKIWSELSPKDRQVAYAIAKCSNDTIKDIREILDMQTNEFNPYRKRLLRKGIINGESRGHVHFTLPLFDEFVLDNYF
ncbi:MAG: ATP-binding protein [Eubacterium sp.]|nr:ATP-binding protein [Eubacterium sp.]